jgi:hypothetical protein
MRLERRLEKLVSAPACRIVHHAGASGGGVSDKQWAEPRDTWIPLRQAVFVFGMTEDDEAAAIHDEPFLGLSTDDFASIATQEVLQKLKKKLKSEANDAEIAERAAAPFSRRQLTRMLKDRSGAHSAEIDPNTSTFLFHFRSVSGSGASLLGVSPWELERKKGDRRPEPQLDAEALYNKEGLVRISDEEAALHEKQDQSARKAAGLVFRQFIVRSFDRAISTKSVVIYAQAGDLSAPFKRLPAHVWPLLEVADWANGVAVAPDGTAYWSIHVQSSSAETPLAEAADPRSSLAPPTPARSVAPPPVISTRTVDQSRNRGVRPEKQQQALRAMRTDIQTGKLAVETLREMLQKELLSKYGTPFGIKSRETVTRARNAVVSVIVANSNSDK